MPTDLGDIIGAAVDAAEAGEAGGADEVLVGDDPGEADGGDEGGDEAEVPAGGDEGEGDEIPAGETKKPAEKPAEKKVERTPEDDEIDKLLEEHGVKAPKPGDRDNRIPYSRTRKIIGNALKKVREGHTLTLKEKDVLLNTQSGRLKSIEQVEAMIFADPDRYILSLAALYPDKYGKYAQGGKVERPPTEQEKAAAADPKPEPDHKFEDGSMGYTPEQFEKLQLWNRREAVREAEEKFEAKYGKRFEAMDAAEKAAQADAERLPKIRAEVDSLRETWGEEFFGQHEKTILAELKKVDTDARAGKGKYQTLTQVANRVLAKLTKEGADVNRNKMREELLKEIGGRAKAPNVTGKKVKAAGADDGAPRRMEDVINAAIDAAGLDED